MDIRQRSPASLQAACMAACRDRYDRKDELILRGFFEAGNDQQTFLYAIEKIEIDRFRPLVYFMKGKTKNPDDKVVELIAWLIDFKDRPYDRLKNYSIACLPSQRPPIDKGIEATLPAPAGNENGLPLYPKEPNEMAPNPISSGDDIKRKKRKRFMLTITISIAFGMVVFLTWPYKPIKPPKYPLTGNEACMYWDEDHYQPVSCNQKIENVQVIALDTAILKKAHKITRPDTITLNAIGSVWYVKYRGELEYYTDSGSHPLDPNLRLKPITAYMIRKYIHPAP